MSNGKDARNNLIIMSPFQQLITNFTQTEKVLSDMLIMLENQENMGLLKNPQAQKHLYNIQKLVSDINLKLKT